jgi:hypothetical protein
MHMQAQKTVFIPGDDIYAMALVRDKTRIRQPILDEQRKLVEGTRDDDWSVQHVTADNIRTVSTLPSGWHLAKKKINRPLVYVPHQRPNGEKGVVVILMAVPLKADEPLYTNPEEPYIFQQCFLDSENRLGINIRKGVPEAPEEDVVMEDAAPSKPKRARIDSASKVRLNGKKMLLATQFMKHRV